MRKGALITTFITIIFTGMAVSHSTADSNQTRPNLKSSYIRISSEIDSPVQEKTRYIYLGARTCAGKCHNSEELGFQYDQWKNSLHSEAYKILSSDQALKYSKEANLMENPQESSACLKCHITAYGFDPASFSDTYSKEDGVTCEACHKREFNPKTFIPDEKVCLKCHNDSIHKVPGFNFNEATEKISHPRPKPKPDEG